MANPIVARVLVSEFLRSTAPSTFKGYLNARQIKSNVRVDETGLGEAYCTGHAFRAAARANQ
jgi:hypothetical protein